VALTAIMKNASKFLKIMVGNCGLCYFRHRK